MEERLLRIGFGSIFQENFGCFRGEVEILVSTKMKRDFMTLVVLLKIIIRKLKVNAGQRNRYTLIFCSFVPLSQNQQLLSCPSHLTTYIGGLPLCNPLLWTHHHRSYHLNLDWILHRPRSVNYSLIIGSSSISLKNIISLRQKKISLIYLY